jgi:BON domain
MSQPVPPLVETLKKAATVLRQAGIPFALAGGGAAYARGAAPPMHDIDFVIMEKDVDKAAEAYAAAGMPVERPPEGWLIKTFNGDHMIDLIYCLAGQPVTWQLLDRAEELSVAAMPIPVLGATDLVLSWLESFSEHHADFAGTLTCVRPMREQVDWDVVRSNTKDSPFARAFLVLLEGLDILPSQPTTQQNLAGRLEQALATDARTHELGVRVEVEGGIAYLRGEVAAAERRDLIGRVAKEAAPGIAIRNEVTVMEVLPPDPPRENI